MFWAMDPYLQIFFFKAQANPKQGVSKKSLHFELVSDFVIFDPKTRCFLKQKKDLYFGPVLDFMVWITFQVYMFDKFCHVVTDPSCSHPGLQFENSALYIWHDMAQKRMTKPDAGSIAANIRFISSIGK